MKEKFKESLKMVMTTNEIDYCIDYAKGREKRWLKRFKSQYNPETNYSFIMLVNAIESPLLWKDIITQMVSGDE